MAWLMLFAHWLLLFGWGIALNDSWRGYLYCRLAVPALTHLTLLPWAFTAIGLVALVALDAATPARRKSRIAYYPAALFALTQVAALWIDEMSMRY